MLLAAFTRILGAGEMSSYTYVCGRQLWTGRSTHKPLKHLSERKRDSEIHAMLIRMNPAARHNGSLLLP